MKYKATSTKCDTCKHNKGFDNSIPACGHCMHKAPDNWEAKEDEKDVLFNTVKVYSRSTGGAGEIFKIFKQHIKESLIQAEDYNRLDLNNYTHEQVKARYRHVFNWILKDY